MSRKNRSSQSLTIAQAIDGFIKYKVVEGLSDRTLAAYEGHLSLFLERAGNLSLEEVNPLVIEDFLFWLRTEYRPENIMVTVGMNLFQPKLSITTMSA